MAEKTFGAWLLEQTERGDTTGTLARAWKQLRDARGHGRVTRAKSIGELLSGQLGEDWERLQGEQAMQLAESEWKGAEPSGEVDWAQRDAEHHANVAGQYQLTEQGAQAAEVLAPYQTLNYGVQARAADEQYAQYAWDPAADGPGEALPRYAVLVVNGLEVSLEAGKRYVLNMGMPEIREEVAVQPDAAEFSPTLALHADGSLDWASLWGQADHTVPEGDDLVSLGLLTREEES
jgi:hypothetical protein